MAWSIVLPAIFMQLVVVVRCLNYVSPCSTGQWNCSARQGAVGVCSSTTAVGCCSPAFTTSLTCSTVSAAYPVPLSSSSGTIESFCLSDSAQRVCSTGFLVKGVCIGSTNCTPCRSNSVGRLMCTVAVPGRMLNTSACRWQATDSSGRASCTAGYEAMTGLCVSSTSSGCNGGFTSIRCCVYQAVNFSRTSTMSETRLHNILQSQSQTATLSANVRTGTVTAKKTLSKAQSRSSSVIPTFTSLLTQTVTQSISPASRTLSMMTFPLTTTREESSPSSSDTYSMMMSKSISMTTRPPTRTPFVTASSSLYDALVAPVLILSPWGGAASSGITAETIHDGPTVFSAVLKHATWRYEAVPFIDQQIFGSDLESPFGWNEQKEATFDSVQYVAGNRSQILIVLKSNVCYESKETLTMIASNQFTTASRTVTATIEIGGSSGTSKRQAIALSVIILTMLLLVVSAFLGNQGVAVLMFMEVQVTTVLGSQSCSRANIRDYFDAIFWIVAPTKNASSFTFDKHFGVVLLHCILPVACFTAYVMVCRMRKRARLFFPSLPLTFGYLTIIGATSHAWLDIVHATYPVGWRVFSLIGWLLFVAAVALSVYRIRSPRGLEFLSYSGIWKTILSGTYFPQQLRSKYALLTDMWNEEYMQYSSPVHLLHLSVTTVFSAMSWSTVAGCFIVLSLQLTWQLIILLLIFWNRPGRSLFHNIILTTQAFTQLLTVIAQVLSLDCGGKYPANVNAAEALVLITLFLHLFLAAAACIGIRYERVHRVKTQLEAQTAAYKLREETLMLQGGPGSSNNLKGLSTLDRDLLLSKKNGFPLLPNIKYHEMKPRVSTDASLLVTDRQKRLASDNSTPSREIPMGTYHHFSATRRDSMTAAESVEMKEIEAVVRSKLWKEVNVVEEARDVGELEQDIPSGSNGPLIPSLTTSATTAMAHQPVHSHQQHALGARCRRCLQRLPGSGICSNCESLSYL